MPIKLTAPEEPGLEQQPEPEEAKASPRFNPVMALCIASGIANIVLCGLVGVLWVRGGVIPPEPAGIAVQPQGVAPVVEPPPASSAVDEDTHEAIADQPQEAAQAPAQAVTHEAAAVQASPSDPVGHQGQDAFSVPEAAASYSAAKAANIRDQLMHFRESVDSRIRSAAGRLIDEYKCLNVVPEAYRKEFPEDTFPVTGAGHVACEALIRDRAQHFFEWLSQLDRPLIPGDIEAYLDQSVATELSYLIHEQGLTEVRLFRHSVHTVRGLMLYQVFSRLDKERFGKRSYYYKILGSVVDGL